MPFPSEPSQWSYYEFLKAYFYPVIYYNINISLNSLSKYVTVFIVFHCKGNAMFFCRAEYGPGMNLCNSSVGHMTIPY